jgi:hypothetical protein
MTVAIKELIVVLAIGVTIFCFAKPLAMRFGGGHDFVRRRNVWFALTMAAFLSPNFWLFALPAIPLLIWAGRKDTNPVGLYLILLHVVPPVSIAIPVEGINQLFDLNNYRLLSFCILIPAAHQLRRSKNPARIQRLQVMDILLLCYGALQVLLFVPPDLPGHIILHNSLTNDLRQTFLFFVDVYVLYFVVSRSCSTRRAILDAMAAFCLSSTIMAVIGIFESLRHWLLYTDMAARWNPSDALWTYSYLIRDGVLRTQASAGHALVLGYLLAIAFGFWLYLKSHTESKRTNISVSLLLCLGLLAAYSRGPWIGAVVIYLIFTAIGPRAVSGLFKAAGVAALLVVGISLSPLGKRIAAVLPFMGGSVDNGNIEYRHRLTERSWQIIQDHPFFGDQLAILKMEDLRQGQGIIDVVNTYAGIAIFNGLIALGAFVGFILVALFKTYKVAKESARPDPDFSLLGCSLVACILGMLLMLENCSFFLGCEKLFYVLAGLAAAYAHLGRSTDERVAVGSVGSPARGYR